MQSIYLNAVEAKKYLVFLSVLILSQSSNAQIEKGLATSPLSVAVKAKVYLKNDSVLKGRVVQITDSTITLDIENSLKNDTGNLVGVVKTYLYYTAKAEDINYIKVRRKAFLTGLVGGGFIGYGLGYAAGFITHRYEDGVTSDQNDNDAKARGVGVGLVGAASLAALGSVIAPVLLRKKFVVDGKRENLREVEKVIYESL